MELNDIILHDALLDAAEEEFADILDSGQPPVRFSKKYLAQRRRFLKNPTKYSSPHSKVWHRVLMQTAVAALVILSLLGTQVFTGVASASELQIATKSYKDHLTYSFAKEYTPTADAGDWYASYLPEGFNEYKVEDFADFCSIHYVNGTKLIDLVYFHNSAYMNININNGSYSIQPCNVNGEAAIFHKAENDGSSNVLMWFSPDGELVFLLDAALPVEELVKIAEGIILK